MMLIINQDVAEIPNEESSAKRNFSERIKGGAGLLLLKKKKASIKENEENV